MTSNTILIVAGAFALGVVLVYIFYRVKLGNIKTHGYEILENARKEGEALKKERLLEAKDESLKLKQQIEEENRVKSRELRDLEKEFQKRESNIERKMDMLDSRYESLQNTEDSLKKREKEVEERSGEVDEIIRNQNRRLEEIAGLNSDDAKKLLMESMFEKARVDAQLKMKEIKDEALMNANKKAREIVIEAIQRSAADHTAETTVTSVLLPSEQMKGRIIGREGRNIRHFETLTGVELIVDDTPDTVVLSGFDPVRREIARLALEKLIQDGRIHPARIEEMINKASKEIEESIMQAAQDALMELGLPPMNQEMLHQIGRLRYRTSYGQNVLKHSIEVGILAGLMASELGLDGQMAKRAGFLHDIGKATDRNVEGTHTAIGGEIARRNKENAIVINAIESHHNEVAVTHPISALVQAADAISGSRRGARGQTLESYIHRMEKLEEISNGFAGVAKTYAIQAGREVRVMVEQDKLNDYDSGLLADEIAQKIQNEMTYPGHIKVTVIREHRSVAYAK